MRERCRRIAVNNIQAAGSCQADAADNVGRRPLEGDQREDCIIMPAKTNTGNRLLSVWTGDDAHLLPELIRYYCRRPDPLVLDCNYGGGRFWGLQGDLNVIGLDIENKPGITLQADNRQLPIRDRSIDVVVYDPPHLTDQATSTGREKFIGLYGDAGYHTNCSYLFPDFLTESARVLKFPGLLICEMIDTVNRRRQEWQHLDFMVMARDHGFTVDDLIIKIRKNPTISGVWKRNFHARKCHSYFIICRRGRSRDHLPLEGDLVDRDHGSRPSVSRETEMIRTTELMSGENTNAIS